jgi:2-polyprenyl-3-methyl-5-hydroxy-6-metoxy-1,4-benzoquinol methylase
MQTKEHWENVYTANATNEVSWFQQHAGLSLKLIMQEVQTPETAEIIDVGGGASVLVDDLLANGFNHISVLDLSGAALAAAKSRLGKRADSVQWIEANLLESNLPQSTYDVWHDRALFHFLTSPEERQAYVQAVLHALKPGGAVIIATFAENGPLKCSGLQVKRYSMEELYTEFGNSFTLIESTKSSHFTPAGKEQEFVYCSLRKTVT